MSANELVLRWDLDKCAGLSGDLHGWMLRILEDEELLELCSSPPLSLMYPWVEFCPANDER